MSISSLSGATIEPLTGRPRLRLALPTPLEPAPRLAALAGLAQLHIKREDLSGYALGGNKLRQIDFILAEALAAGADTIIATAGSQSNFCRALAGACARLGLACHLHLRARLGTAPVGNLLLDGIFGAQISFTDRTDPWDPRIRAELDEIAARLRAAGRTPFVAQLTGNSAISGIAGWVAGAAEMLADFDRLGLVVDRVVVASGSGLTAAGLALGFKHLGAQPRILAISVQQPADRLSPWMVDAANRAAAAFGMATRLDAADFDCIDDHIGPGYGQPSPASLAAVRAAGRSEGLVLDPVYTGKAMAGLLAEAATGRLAQSRTVFLHSGGTPGLFAHGAAFAGEAA